VVSEKRFGGRITWLGHAAFLIESPKGARIAIDPWIHHNPKFPKGFEYGPLDAVAATHGHFDHFGDDGIRLVKDSGATLVAIFELALHAGAHGVEKFSGMNKGGAQTVAGVEFRMVHAVHSAGTSGAGKENNFPADPCGYVLTFEDGFKVYHAGDTNVFSDMALIAELYAPDVALLPIGDFYTMGPREAAYVMRLLRSPFVVPCHYGTFPALTGTPDAFRAELSKLGVQATVVAPKPGESVR